MQKRCILCADPDPELRSNLGFLLAGETGIDLSNLVSAAAGQHPAAALYPVKNGTRREVLTGERVFRLQKT